MDISWALNQTAVWWSRNSPDGYGDYDWDDPVEIAVRWEQKSELKVDINGEQFATKAEVLLDTDIVIGDRLLLGDLDDITSASSGPASMEGALEVKAFEKIPSIDGTEFVRTAWL